MGEWGPTATRGPGWFASSESSRWGNGGQPQHEVPVAVAAASLADGGMGANRNDAQRFSRAGHSLADGGMGANRNVRPPHHALRRSLADGGMGANRNDPAV